MDKIYVVYWSGTGNTQTMAEMIGSGIGDGGKQAEVIAVSDIKPDMLKEQGGFALGCPSMGDEVLEESEMEDFVTAVEGFAAGKKIALFGSYGWGDGQWMRDWEVRMSNAGAVIVNDAGIIAQESPDKETEEKLRNLGKVLAE